MSPVKVSCIHTNRNWRLRYMYILNRIWFLKSLGWCWGLLNFSAVAINKKCKLWKCAVVIYTDKEIDNHGFNIVFLNSQVISILYNYESWLQGGMHLIFLNISKSSPVCWCSVTVLIYENVCLCSPEFTSNKMILQYTLTPW